jgi:guanylate kinase
MRSFIFVISGPSGSGKTTLLESLLKAKQLKDKLVKPVSFTTRPRRPDEKDGRDYFFITQREFRQKKQEKKFLEWTRHLGYYYATSKDFLQRHFKQARHIILCLDLKGAFQIRKFYPKKTVLIFVMPPSLEALRQRIQIRRCQTKKREIAQRIKLAQKELLAAKRYDYCVLNKDLRSAVKELKNIILNKINV